MLLSDRDIKAEIDRGRIGLEPYDPGLVQPSSIDVRLDRYFRVFENHRYPHIDPELPDLRDRQCQMVRQTLKPRQIGDPAPVAAQ